MHENGKSMGFFTGEGLCASGGCGRSVSGCGKTQNRVEYTITGGACDGASGDRTDFKRRAAADGAEVKAYMKCFAH